MVLEVFTNGSLSKLYTVVNTNDKLQLNGFLHLCSQCGSLHSRINPNTLCFLPVLLLLATLYQDAQLWLPPWCFSFTCYRVLNTESILWFLFNLFLWLIKSYEDILLHFWNQKPQISVHAPLSPQLGACGPCSCVFSQHGTLLCQSASWHSASHGAFTGCQQRCCGCSGCIQT